VIRLKILITGVGLVGKSTFRRTLKRLISVMGMSTEDIDGDYQELPTDFKEGVVYVIEDVHGTTSEACLPLADYDLVLYLLPTPLSHFIFWLKRIWIWFQIGRGSWDKHRKGWLGSGKRYDILNIPLFIKLLLYDFWNRRKWITQDTEILSQVKDVVVFKPRWTKKGILFNLFQKAV
jgi:hypothetical protein